MKFWCSVEDAMAMFWPCVANVPGCFSGYSGDVLAMCRQCAGGVVDGFVMFRHRSYRLTGWCAVEGVRGGAIDIAVLRRGEPDAEGDEGKYPDEAAGHGSEQPRRRPPHDDA